MKHNLLALVCLCAGTCSAADSPIASHAGPDALARLRQGNQTYLADRFAGSTQLGPARRAEVMMGQHPFATIVSCADSRVPPEIVFGQGLGDLFVIRVAGAVAGPTVLGSIEYAAEHLHVPLVVVMGHTSCGAVKAAMETPAPVKKDLAGANLEQILGAIRPSLAHALPYGDAWLNAVYSSVEQNIADVLRLSPVLDEMAESGKVIFVGAVYELESGRVHFSEAVTLKHHAQTKQEHK